MTQAYVYHWFHKPTEKWYIGSRTAKNCHPKDGYITSSKIIKPMIKKHPHQWIRTIVAVGERNNILNFEKILLNYFDAANDPMSWNLNNGPGTHNKSSNKNYRHSEEAKRKMKKAWANKRRSKRMKGENNPNYGKTHSPEVRQKISESLKGKPTWMKGKKHSDETRQKMKEAWQKRKVGA